MQFNMTGRELTFTCMEFALYVVKFKETFLFFFPMGLEMRVFVVVHDEG